MSIKEDRGRLIDQIAKIGLVGTIREGYFDLLTQKSDGDTGENPVTNFRLQQLEDTSETHTSNISELQQTATLQNGMVVNLQQVTTRLERSVSTQDAEIVRLTDAITKNQASHVLYDAHFTTLDGANADLTAQIELVKGRVDGVDSLNVTQNNRLTTLEGLVSGNEPGGLAELRQELDNKVDLVDGKIPLSQLPELPTGRKVTVADEAARLVLPVHADITIAYQQSDGVAYILGAGDDPSVAAKWQKLSSTQGSGITAFNGRTGVVTPQAGDYNADQIAHTADRTFVLSTDRQRWDDKIGPVALEEHLSQLRKDSDAKYLQGDATVFLRKDDNTVLKTSRLATANGIATLGSDGKVLPSQLPVIGLTPAQETRLRNVEELADLANQKGDVAADNSVLLDMRLRTVEAAGTNLSIVNGQVQTLRTQRVSDKALIDENTAKNAEQDVRIKALEDRPAGTATPRKYTNVKGSRTVGNWFRNTTDNEMQLYLSSTKATTVGRQLVVYVREYQASTWFTFVSPMVSISSDKILSINVIVPAGFEYQVASAGVSSTATIDSWVEFA